MHISDQGRNKLDPKLKKCTFIGYGEDEFGYRIWDDENKNVIRKKDVILKEKVMYKDRHKTDAKDLEQSGTVFAKADDIPDGTPTEQIITSPQQEEL